MSLNFNLSDDVIISPAWSDDVITFPKLSNDVIYEWCH